MTRPTIHTPQSDYPTQAVTFRMLPIAEHMIFTQLDTLLAGWLEASDRVLNRVSQLTSFPHPYIGPT